MSGRGVRDDRASRRHPHLERFKFSTIAHSDHRFCSPISSARADQLLSLLELRPGQQVLDVGCGKAEMLIRLVEQYRVSAVGVDRSPPFLAEARQQAETRIASTSIALHEQDAADFTGGAFDAALCIGAADAYGSYASCLRRLSERVRPRGYLLLGHPYWKRQPNPGYLEALGASATDYTDHAGNVAAGVEAQLVPLYSATSSDDEWDHYEGLYLRAVERYLRDHPADPDYDEMRQRIRAWRDTYLRWGRDTLGFGFYLFRRD